MDVRFKVQGGANVTGTLGVSGMSTTILPSPTLSWTSVATTHDGTLRTPNVRPRPRREQGQADGNLVLIADSGEISGPMPYLGYP
jgi:hypothetical protein